MKTASVESPVLVRYRRSPATPARMVRTEDESAGIDREEARNGRFVVIALRTISALYLSFWRMLS